MDTRSLIALTALLLAGCSMVGVPRTAEEVAAATGRLASDGYRPADPFLIVGPQIPIGANAWGRLVAHVGRTDLELHCTLGNGAGATNLTKAAYLENGTELLVSRPPEAMASFLRNGNDVFIVRVPQRAALEGLPAPIRLKAYGPERHRELEVPAWYVEGFHRTAAPTLGGR